MVSTTTTSTDRSRKTLARRLLLHGHVQGLGVRPAIFRLATEMGVVGNVRNSPRGVEIEIEGPAEKLAQFERALPAALPAAAMLVDVDATSIPPAGHHSFSIVHESTDGPLATRVPADRALCPDCEREVQQPDDRRHEYAFTSCTRCGPRYTVIRAMPFERDDTVMCEFPLCTDCRHEYERPTDRRFHAQTTACPECGPRLEFRDHAANCTLFGDSAVHAVAAELAAGRIAAIRGLGGYQLLVDATNESAVERLRTRKGRRGKPLAVMVASAESAQQLALMDAAELAVFDDPAAPIVLARARPNSGLAAAIHPHLDTVGLMRPTTPLHALIARVCGRPLVCTSGNREGDPLEYEVDAAEERLADVADVWLHHDREITRPIDDSVVRVIAGRRVTIRLARGLAPLPLELPPLPPTIALGGFFKVAAAWSNGVQTVLGPHVGDQESLAARERYLAHLDDWQRLYGFRPELLVHDLHPEYFTSQWAARQPLRTMAVQHHHAHVVAGMLEHGWLDREVLGVAWDGTGYGTDDTVWGGEFLVSTADTFSRMARLRPFRLPGNEAAIRQPWRTAVAVCRQLGVPFDFAHWPGWNRAEREIANVQQIVDQPQFSPLTTSAGRLFDAAAALVLGVATVDFDGQAAMRLEAAADRSATGYYEFPLVAGSPAELDWRPLFAALLDEFRRGVDPGILAMRVHRSLAQGIVAACRQRPDLPVVLAGGVFQNRLLTELVQEAFDGGDQLLGLPAVIPPNDGGLAAGQLAITAARGIRPCA